MNSNEILSPGCSFSDLAGQAWNALKGKWGVTIGTFLIAALIQSAAGFIPVAGNFTGILLFPLSAGLLLFTLQLVRRKDPPETALIFEPFKQYWHYVWGNLRVAVFVFLWTLLLIVPGIVAAIRFSMTFYIMLDHPDYSVKDAMTESSRIMYGHKWQYFGYSLLMGLIFLGGAVCTLGIGLLWLIPWGGTFIAAFYEAVRLDPAGTPASPESGDAEAHEIPAAEE